MSKPVGYYTSYTPNSEGLLDEMQEQYGPTLDGINTREKLYLITSIASHLCCLESLEMRSEIFDLAGQIYSQLSADDQVGLLQALINQIKYQNKGYV